MAGFNGLIPKSGVTQIGNRYPRLSNQHRMGQGFVKAGSDMSPLRGGHAEGISRLGQALIGSWMQNNANEAIKAKEATRTAGVTDFIKGLSNKYDTETVPGEWGGESTEMNSTDPMGFGFSEQAPDTTKQVWRQPNQQEMMEGLAKLSASGNSDMAQGIAMQQALSGMNTAAQQKRADEVYARGRTDADTDWGRINNARIEAARVKARVDQATAADASAEAQRRVIRERWIKQNSPEYKASVAQKNAQTRDLRLKGDISQAVIDSNKDFDKQISGEDNLSGGSSGEDILGAPQPTNDPLIGAGGADSLKQNKVPSVREIFNSLPPEAQVGISTARDKRAAFSKYLLQRKGLDIKFNEKGQIESIQQGGTGGGSGGMNARPVDTALQKSQITNIESLIELDEIGKSYHRDYLTYGGRIKDIMLAVKSKANYKLTPKEKKFVNGRRTFTQGVNRGFNAYRKEITGAAAAVKELADLKKATLNTDLSPDQFEASFRTYQSALKRSLRVKNMLLRKGIINVGGRMSKIQGKAFDDAFKNGGDDNHIDRGRELAAQGLPDDQILSILSREGYLG